MKYAAFKPIAEKLASHIAPGLVPFTPPGPGLSTKARWFRDGPDQLLVVVVAKHETTDVTDDVLAYALAWQCDRDLVLVLPGTHVGLTLERLPWIETPVRVFTYSDDLPLRPMVIPSRTEILALAKGRPLRSTETHDLKGRDVLVEQLVRRLENHWALVRAHRPGYLAWHCLGRQVVKITRTTKSVTILAGVAYPPPGETKALLVSVDEHLLPLDLAEVEHRVSDAIRKRYAGHDRGHDEHRMQAALASTGLSKLDIQPGHLNREYTSYSGPRRQTASRTCFAHRRIIGRCGGGSPNCSQRFQTPEVERPAPSPPSRLRNSTSTEERPWLLCIPMVNSNGLRRGRARPLPIREGTPNRCGSHDRLITTGDDGRQSEIASAPSGSGSRAPRDVRAA